jgi:hypothetical protein
MALFLEGGYEPAALESSVQATLAPLVGVRTHAPAPTKDGPGMAQLRDASIERLRALDRTFMEDAPP